MAIMNRQHEIFHLAFGAMYWPADLIEPKLVEGTPIRILDVGSKSGIW